MHAAHVVAHNGAQRLEQTRDAALGLCMVPTVPVHRVERVLHHPKEVAQVRGSLPGLRVDGLDVALCSGKSRPDLRQRGLRRMALTRDHGCALRCQKVGELVAQDGTARLSAKRRFRQTLKQDVRECRASRQLELLDLDGELPALLCPDLRRMAGEQRVERRYEAEHIAARVTWRGAEPDQFGGSPSAGRRDEVGRVLLRLLVCNEGTGESRHPQPAGVCDDDALR